MPKERACHTRFKIFLNTSTASLVLFPWTVSSSSFLFHTCSKSFILHPHSSLLSLIPVEIQWIQLPLTLLSFSGMKDWKWATHQLQDRFTNKVDSSGKTLESTGSNVQLYGKWSTQIFSTSMENLSKNNTSYGVCSFSRGTTKIKRMQELLEQHTRPSANGYG